MTNSDDLQKRAKASLGNLVMIFSALSAVTGVFLLLVVITTPMEETLEGYRAAYRTVHFVSTCGLGGLTAVLMFLFCGVWRSYVKMNAPQQPATPHEPR